LNSGYGLAWNVAHQSLIKFMEKKKLQTNADTGFPPVEPAKQGRTKSEVKNEGPSQVDKMKANFHATT